MISKKLIPDVYDGASRAVKNTAAAKAAAVTSQDDEEEQKKVTTVGGGMAPRNVTGRNTATSTLAETVTARTSGIDKKRTAAKATLSRGLTGDDTVDAEWYAAKDYLDSTEGMGADNFQKWMAQERAKYAAAKRDAQDAAIEGNDVAESAAKSRAAEQKHMLQSAGVRNPDATAVGAAMKNTGGTLLNTFGTLVGALGANADETAAAVAGSDTVAMRNAWKLMTDPEAADREREREAENAAEAYETVTAKGDELIQKGATDTESMKTGKGNAGKLLVDLGVQAVQMGTDAAANAIAPGLGTASLGARSFGGAASEARADGATIGQQVAYGSAVAATEMLTEKLFGAFSWAYGKGVSDKLVNDVVTRLATTELGQAAWKLGFSSIGEGFEEGISDIMQPVYQQIYLGSLEERGGWFANIDPAQLAYDMFVGTLMGFLMEGGQNVVQGNFNLGEDGQRAYEYARQAAAEGKTLKETCAEYTEVLTKEAQQEAVTEMVNAASNLEAAQSSGDEARITVAQNEYNAAVELANEVFAEAQVESEADAQAVAEQIAEPQTDAGEDNPGTGTSLEPVQQNAGADETAIAETRGENIGNDGVPLEPNMKESRVSTNTERSVAGKLGGEQETLYYIPKTEKESLYAAAARVNADMVGEMSGLEGKTAWTGEDIDTAMTIYGKLKADEVKNGSDPAAVNAWAKLIQTRGTNIAQALQAFSKWSRTGSAVAANSDVALQNAVLEGNITQANADRVGNDVGDFGKRYDAITDESQIDELRELILAMNDYRRTGTLVKGNFRKILYSANVDFDYLKNYAFHQLNAITEDATIKADIGQQLKAWQVKAQLTRLGTFFRNIGGNITFGVVDTMVNDSLGIALDAAIGKATGKREVALDKGWLSSKAREAAIQAGARSILEVAGDVDLGGSGKYGTNSSRTNKASSGNAVARFMSRWEQLLSYSLTTTDRISRGQIEAAATEGLSKYNSAEDAAKLAENKADYELFQNDGLAKHLSQGAHDVLNLVGVGGELEKGRIWGRKGGFGLGDAFMAYPGVPANLGVKAFEYSPANIAKGTVEMVMLLRDAKNGKAKVGQQQQAVMDIARGMAGVPIIAGLAALCKNGIVRNSDDEDYDEKAERSSEGRSGIQINISAMLRAQNGESAEWQDGDELLSIGWLEPINAFLAIALNVANDDSQNDTVLGQAEAFSKDYLEGAIQSVMEIPSMQSITNIVETLNGKYAGGDSTLPQRAGEAAIGLAQDTVTGMIPGFVTSIGKTIDPYTRDTRGDTDWETFGNKIANNLPFLREMLPEKLDNFGNPIMDKGSLYNRAMNNLVRPGKITTFSQNASQKLVDDLYDRTGDARAVPDRKFENKFTYKDEKLELTQDERNKAQQTSGAFIEDMVTRLTASEAFDSLTDEDKIGVISSIKSLAKKYAEREILVSRGVIADESEYDFGNSYGYLNNISDDELTDYLVAQTEFHNAGAGLDANKDGTPKSTDFTEVDRLVKDVYPNLSESIQSQLLSSYSHLDELSDAAKVGIGSEEWFHLNEQYKDIQEQVELAAEAKGESPSKAEMANLWSRWLDENGYSGDKKALVKEQMKYWNFVPAESKNYDNLVENMGFSTEKAYDLVTGISELVPREGVSNVSNEQKFDYIGDLYLGGKLTGEEFLCATMMYAHSQEYVYIALVNSGRSKESIEAVWNFCIEKGWWKKTLDEFAYSTQTDKETGKKYKPSDRYGNYADK